MPLSIGMCIDLSMTSRYPIDSHMLQVDVLLQCTASKAGIAALGTGPSLACDELHVRSHQALRTEMVFRPRALTRCIRSSQYAGRIL